MIDSACFGHGCPPLQHFGQKTVCGHVTTNSGSNILIQITFDVMSVRKPFCEHGSSDERWCDHHLQSRILSHHSQDLDGDFDSCTTLTRLSLCALPNQARLKALVMTREAVLNEHDVGEEVYVE